jgi:hypothetical protein
MINGNVNEFVNNLDFEHQAVIYKGHKLFFEGVIYYRERREKNKYNFEIYQYSLDEIYEKDFFSIWCDSVSKCIEEFIKAPIFDGKTFWEVEKEMEQIDTF